VSNHDEPDESPIDWDAEIEALAKLREHLESGQVESGEPLPSPPLPDAEKEASTPPAQAPGQDDFDHLLDYLTRKVFGPAARKQLGQACKWVADKSRAFDRPPAGKPDVAKPIAYGVAAVVLMLGLFLALAWFLGR
jgi:hypothetical protein